MRLAVVVPLLLCVRIAAAEAPLAGFVADLASDDARERAACDLVTSEATGDADAWRAVTRGLLVVLHDGTSEGRACAALALAAIAPRSTSAAPDLAIVLRDEAVPVLVLGLDQRTDMCRAAADALGAMGPLAKGAVPRLSDALDREACEGQKVHVQAALERILEDG